MVTYIAMSLRHCEFSHVVVGKIDLHRGLHSTRSKGSYVFPTLDFSPPMAQPIKIQVGWSFYLKSPSCKAWDEKIQLNNPSKAILSM